MAAKSNALIIIFYFTFCGFFVLTHGRNIEIRTSTKKFTLKQKAKFRTSVLLNSLYLTFLRRYFLKFTYLYFLNDFIIGFFRFWFQMVASLQMERNFVGYPNGGHLARLKMENL